ncbi:MAG: GNAT family N-acetyltransferase [Actinobacteria bacterium]|nr:MAG: GNAT family N-acetyltransferase [Actinomycetota bacterium]
MQVRRVEDPADFLDAATPLLLADEARHNLMLGIAGTLRDHPSRYPEYRLWLVKERSATVGAALRTPPHKLVLARPRADSALEALAAGIDDELPGVVAALPEAETFAAAWATKIGTTPRKTRAEGLFALERVQRVPPVPGRMRVADAADRPLLIDWFGAFAEEALGEDAVLEKPDRVIDHRLTADSAGIVLWEVEHTVSLAAFGNPTPNGIRIGPVYTPPQHRRHGYASALVAELSERLLAERRFCFLFTDLANPTANRIYEQIGYRRVCEAAEIAFDAG